MKKFVLFPWPQSVEMGDCKIEIKGKSLADCNFEVNNSLGKEEYYLNVSKDNISAIVSGQESRFRAETTLKQILSYDAVPELHIHDFPSVTVRGAMLDISRSKIPTLDTLKRAVDFFASIKLNHLELYVEGFPVAYPSFKEVWKYGTPLTPEEIKELDLYCKERFIDLAANQNCLGHMAPWLIRQEFNHLAECPNGFLFVQDHNLYWPPHTLNPQDPESFEFVKKLLDDLMPMFTSDIVNINCDETFELKLKLGKSKELCEEIGYQRVYFDFVKKVMEYVGEKGKKVMFWCDMLNSAPDLVKELPEYAMPITWGYSAHMPKEETLAEFEKLGRPYFIAPGTSSWNTILGTTHIMMSNAENAVLGGVKHNVYGVLDTDWGDLNHLQYWPFSYMPFAYCGALCWNADTIQKEYMCEFLNKFLYKDESNRFAQLMYDAGLYLTKADFSVPKTRRGYVEGILYYDIEEQTMVENIAPEDLKALEDYFDILESRLNEITKLGCDDGQLILDEFKNALRIVRFIAQLGYFKLGIWKDNDKFAHLKHLKQMQDVMLDEHRRLWRARNKESGLKDSISRMKKL